MSSRRSQKVIAGLLALALTPSITSAAPGEKITFYHHDVFGNLIATTNEQGEVVERFTPEPYGATGERMAGRKSEAGQVFIMGARVFDPATGRFLSPDPQQLNQIDLTKPQSLNRYSYAFNNPYRFSDSNGEIPIETLADILDVGMSAYDLYNEPSWQNAGYMIWSLAAVALPYVPGAYVAKGLKAADKGHDAFQRAKAAANAVEEGSTMAQKCAKGGCSTSSLCFVGGTLVATESGLVPIESIKAGDRVWASDGEQEASLQKVTQTFARQADALIQLKISEILEESKASQAPPRTWTIEGTEEHPFYLPWLGRFVPMGELQAGDVLKSRDGQRLVQVVDLERIEVSSEVFNFEVENLHTYFVAASEGSPWALVHNTCSRALGEALESAGHVRPPETAAHHIVAGSAPGAQPARDVLQRVGVDINSADNGVFLPRSSAAPNPGGAAVHSRLHTRSYYETVNDRLSTVSTRDEAVEVLNSLRQSLLGGGL